jgi:glycosyltransferase involved in cell wall biosynthesis
MTSRPRLTVLVPAYNESAGLAYCVAAVQARLAALATPAELLIVDDASRDNTAAVAAALAQANPEVRLIRHAVNGGIGATFTTAVANARGEWLILIPADLAMDLDDLHKYLDAAQTADIVVGNRSDIRDYSLVRVLVHYANITLNRVLFQMPLRQFQYISLYRLATLRQIEIEYAGSAFFLAEVLIKAQALGAHLSEVSVRYVPRTTGRATGAKLVLVVTTIRDMFRFWLRWVRLGPVAASRRRAAFPS